MSKKRLKSIQKKHQKYKYEIFSTILNINTLFHSDLTDLTISRSIINKSHIKLHNIFWKFMKLKKIYQKFSSNQKLILILKKFNIK